MRHPFAFGVLMGLVLAALFGVLLVAPIALAHHSAGSLETAYGNLVVTSLARLNAPSAGANPTTSSSQTLQQGRESYTGACSQCHGTAGHTQGIFGQTSFPPASDLAGDSARSLSDGQIFYIIKNGLGFTPMPAFSSQFSDTQTWALVDFIRALQTAQAPLPDVPTPTADQRTTAHLASGGDAQRGAEAFAAFGCSACHQPSGRLSVNPANDSVAQVVRNGRQGMPCYSSTTLSDTQLLDIRAYIATFPGTGMLGGPQDRAPGGGSVPSASGQGAPAGAVGGGGSSPCASSTGTSPTISSSPSPQRSASPSAVATATP
jgi:mono/diheme cytochrome c family protein